jgi:hypothetical protein
MCAHDDNTATVSTSASVPTKVEMTCKSYIKLLAGRPHPNPEYARDGSAVGTLESFLSTCSDISHLKFEGLEVHGNIEGRPRGAVVHAEVVCDGETYLINVHDDLRRKFISSLLLECAGLQLGYNWQVVTSMMLACASYRFSTLMKVARYEQAELGDSQLRLLEGRYSWMVRPRVHDLVDLFGGGKVGLARTMAAIANGYLRLGRHDVLSMSVPIHRGPLLATGSQPLPEGRFRPTEFVTEISA